MLETLIPAEQEIRAGGKTGEWRWFIRRIAPYRTSDDRIAGLVVTFIDITDRYLREDEIKAARDYAEAIVETAPSPLIILDENLCVMTANPAFYRTFRVDPEDTENVKIYDLGDGQWNIPALRKLVAVLHNKGETFDSYEVTHTFEMIGERTMRLSGRRFEDTEHILLAIEDVTAAKRHDVEQKILTAELSHRVKNALTVVQSIANQTMNRAASMDDFKVAFRGRLSALAQAHGQLMASAWQSADLHDLMRQVFAALAVEKAQVSLTGPPLRLAPRKTLALSLALHELTTNSIKYGSLSNGGLINIDWARPTGENGDHVRLTWRESGGPPVKAPDAKGFGSELIEKYAPYELGGTVEQRFEPGGLFCVFDFSPGMEGDGWE